MIRSLSLLLFLFSLAGFLCPLSGQPGDALLAVKGATLLDVEAEKTVSGAVVLIRGDRILAAGSDQEVSIPEGTKVIDATGKFIMPGLVDAHIHLFQSGGLYTRPDAIDLRGYRPYEAERQWVNDNAADQLRRYLACGITTTIDVGGPMANYALRDRLNQDAAHASVYLTGPLVSTYQPDAFQIEDAPIIEVADAEEARALVRRQLPYRPDFIKIWYIARSEQMARDNYPIVQATIAEAHTHDLRVAVHATQLETARLAVQAGADFLVHSVEDTLVDEAFIQLLQQQGTVYCPTLIVGKNYGLTFLQRLNLDPVDFKLTNPYALGTLFDLQHLPEGRERWQASLAQAEQMMARYEQRDRIMGENLRRLQAAGIPIATGTDAGNIGTLHATSYYDELEAMQQAGLTPWQILRASTLNGAKAVGQENEFGSLRTGKRADLLILNQDPLISLDHWQEVDLVIHRGMTYRPEDLVTVTPEDLAQQQLNAYNARDIDAFLAPYSDTVKIFNFPDQLIMDGKEDMRARYGSRFENTPDLHCELVNRIVLGNTVIDQEKVTIKSGEPLVEAIAVYKIRDGKIAEVYFIRK